MIYIEIIYNFFRLLISVLQFTIFAEAVLSFVPNVKETKYYNVLVSFNYPILEPFRRIQEKFFGNMMVDFSPMMAFMFLSLIGGAII